MLGALSVVARANMLDSGERGMGLNIDGLQKVNMNTLYVHPLGCIFGAKNYFDYFVFFKLSYLPIRTNIELRFKLTVKIWAH